MEVGLGGGEFALLLGPVVLIHFVLAMPLAKGTRGPDKGLACQRQPHQSLYQQRFTPTRVHHITALDRHAYKRKEPNSW